MVRHGVELTVENAWFIAERIGAGTLPWVLAITPPYCDFADRAAFGSEQVAQLTRLGVMVDGQINSSVQQWIHTICHPQRWLELRYVESQGPSADMMRGVAARRESDPGADTVVALRNAQFVTFSPITINDPHGLAGIVTAGMPARCKARFEEFTLPVRVGERADKALRDGADLAAVMEYLGIPESARGVVRAAIEGPRRYVEVVAGQRSEVRTHTTEVGIAVLDTDIGRVLVSPTRGFDDEWVSTFAPGETSAIALALEHLTAELPDGRWFPEARLNHQLTTAAS